MIRQSYTTPSGHRERASLYRRYAGSSGSPGDSSFRRPRTPQKSGKRLPEEQDSGRSPSKVTESTLRSGEVAAQSENPVTYSMRIGVALCLSALFTAVLAVGVPRPAHADRCQPEELVLGSGNAPYREEDSPVCTVMLGVVYPTLGCDSTTLLNCVNSMTPAPVPDVFNPIPPQGPLPAEAENVICSAFSVANGNGVCRPQS